MAPRRITFTKRQTADILAKQADGMSVNDIADIYKVSVPIIKRVIAEQQCKPPIPAQIEDVEDWHDFQSPRLKNMLVKGSPAQYIRYYMWKRHLKTKQLAAKLGTTDKYVRVMIYWNAYPPSSTLCYKLAKALDVDPYEMGRVVSDYKIRKLIEADK